MADRPVLDRFRLDGKVAVVTGASSGLGVAFAQALAEAGADVALGARRVDRLADTASLVERPTRPGLRRGVNEESFGSRTKRMSGRPGYSRGR